MSDSTSYPAKDALPPNVQITFRDDMTQPQQRQAVERSVATHVARSAEAVKRAVDAQAKRAKLLAAVNAPLMRLIEEDPAAVEALHDMRNQPPLAPDSSASLPRDDQPITDIKDPMAPALEHARGARDMRALAAVPPYDYAFRWVHDHGAQPFRQELGWEHGSVLWHARSGRGIAGGDPKFVSASAGFGLILPQTDRAVNVTCYATRRMDREYKLGALALGDVASVEVGTEIAVYEDGTEIAREPSPNVLEVSILGVGSYHNPSLGPYWVGRPRGLTFTMVPGSWYTVNVGISVFTNVEPTGTRSGYSECFVFATVNNIGVGRPPP